MTLPLLDINPVRAANNVTGITMPTRFLVVGNHMGNFVECIKSGDEPISDVYTHHRSMTTCHLANIALRLNRPLKWDVDAEQIIDDDAANGFLSREPRKGYETKV